MDFVNKTKVEAGWTLGFEPDGRELLVIAIKATFIIPNKGEEATLSDEQIPLTEADVFTGEPGYSATLHETDYAHRKLVCDVLLNGSAYAPKGKPTTRVEVGLGIGPVNKQFAVIGDRNWTAGKMSFSHEPPGKFITMPISYDCAYGGLDNFHPDETKHRTYLPNPVGKGFHENLNAEFINGTPMPNTEELNKSVSMPLGKYRPMAFGALGRNFASRYPFAGTLDKKWLDTQAPFWPDDFDYRYFQAAPTDQQIPYPKGGERVTLKNLSPEGITRFQLPKLSMPVLFIPYRGKDQHMDAMIDTLVIEPDNKRFMLTWRVSYPLQKNCFELKKVFVGEKPKSFYRKSRFGNKPYYKNLAELARARKNR